MENGKATLENTLVASCKIKYTIPIQASNCTPGLYPREVKTYVHIKTYTLGFTATFSVIAKNWKQNIFQQVNGWPNCGTCIR